MPLKIFARRSFFYDILKEDPSEATKNIITNLKKTRPGTCKPLIKTHKPKPYPMRLFLSGTGTPVQPISKFVVPAGSPSRGGDVKVHVFDINQPSLPTPFTLFLRLFLSYGPFTCISFHKFSRQLSVFAPAVGSCGRRNLSPIW